MRKVKTYPLFQVKKRKINRKNKQQSKILEIQPQTVFRDFFGSDSYAMFFDENSHYGKELEKAFNDRLKMRLTLHCTKRETHFRDISLWALVPCPT